MRFISRPLRTAAVLSTLAATSFLAACAGDGLTEPQVTRSDATLLSTSALTSVVNALTLTRDVAVPNGVVKSFTFTKKGGTIDMRNETGLRIDIPEGAIPGERLTITVTALPGKAVAYDFQPHGTVFLKPLAFRHDLKYTSWDKLGFKGVIFGGYFKDPSQIDLTRGIAKLDELFPVTIKSSEVSFEVKHFSGYMVSSGRQSMANDEF